ncbi:single-stranded DNA-binding protein [Piscinibacter sp. HJYY11]|uniref:single-stranded DNA-binding protein n=1 Tax=Piscinibacter sp. HJYY11 TaxID=2801333 RepID=UPI00191E8463|nr:single-stranded DNA-binding protein [Piscinibacter sp. HJYY11]MBL0726093.1 single-stranded DNA-binding protein [Piscinibacter sp. HJYY11]
MANVQVIQRNARFAGPVRLEYVSGRDGQVAKGVVTAISNVRWGSGEAREEETTAIQWTLWGRQAESAAGYLGKGSRVNIVGRVRNNNYEKDGQMVYGMTFTVEDLDYLDTKAEGEARRGREQSGKSTNGPMHSAGDVSGSRPVAPNRKAARPSSRSVARPPSVTNVAKPDAHTDVPF